MCVPQLLRVRPVCLWNRFFLSALPGSPRPPCTIAFIRKQEQDILRPACAAISTTEARIERVLDKLATAGQVRDLQKAVSDQQQRQNYDARNLRSDILQLLGRATEQERKAFMYLGKLVDAKEKSGFFNDIATLYKEQG